MKLTDIAPVSSDVLNAKMQAKLGWNIKTENLKVNDAVAMLESVTNKLVLVRNSNKIHVSEKDAGYTGMLMAQQVLESFISEKAKSPYAIGTAAAMKSTGDNPPLQKSTITKAHKIAKKIAKNESVENAIRRMINEDEVTQAQSVMVNEQLPPLTDSIRSNIGDQQAQAFSAAATETLNGLLTQVQGAREAVNNAVLGLTGAAPTPVEAPSVDMGTDLDTEMPADEFGASDAAVGGELPLGREKRA